MGIVSRSLESLNNRVFRRIGRQEIRESVAALGIGPGDVVYAHVSIRRLGFVTGGAPEVAEALRELLGPAGTLVMCAWTSPDARPDASGLFDVTESPARTGLLAETVRRMPDAVRSLHPVASVVAVGARAHEITEGHDRCATPFGAGTPYARLAALKPKLLLIGAHLGGLLHHLQERVDFPNMFDPSPRSFDVRDAKGHHRRISTPVLSAVPPVVILPGSRPENRDYLLVPDYAFMFPTDRERQVMEAGYLRFNRSRFLGRRERLQTRGILKPGRVGATEAAVLDGPRMLEQIRKDLAWDITRFKEEYDPELLSRLSLPVF
jgi:aminoglycoside N3'-acetyltransferase